MRSSDADGSKFMMVQLFMFRLGPPPLSALMYVPIHGSRKSGGEFYESRAATATFLNRDPSQITKAVKHLLEADLVVPPNALKECNAMKREKCHAKQ